MTLLPPIALSLSGNDFLLPYFERQFPQPDPANQTESGPVTAAIKVVIDDAGTEDDAEFDAYCAEKELHVSVLRCPSVVCTGMRGLPRRLAQGIGRGTLTLIRGNEARLSAVHGIDVAAAAALCASRPKADSHCEYVLTDGCDPMVAELCQALAYRMGDKRLLTLPRRLAKIWLGSLYDSLTSCSPVECTFASAFPDFRPHSVCEYLRTHVYDESSL